MNAADENARNQAIFREVNEIERVTAGNDRFLVVEKLGAAAEITRAAEPRQDGTSSEI